MLALSTARMRQATTLIDHKEAIMPLRLLFMCFAITTLLCCACSKGEEQATPDDGAGETGATGERLIRRKIERLDAEAFVQVTLDLEAEQQKWNAEWEKFIQAKRSEYFGSIGLTEDQFNAFPNRNLQDLQNFLEKNPQYNAKYLELKQRDTRRSVYPEIRRASDE
jgi:hypothetical protein